MTRRSERAFLGLVFALTLYAWHRTTRGTYGEVVFDIIGSVGLALVLMRLDYLSTKGRRPR